MPFDENIVCPISGEPLEQAEDRLAARANSYGFSDGIALLDVDENQTSSVERRKAARLQRR
jgi:hypothetical protein